jgi:hypothetical protein
LHRINGHLLRILFEHALRGRLGLNRVNETNRRAGQSRANGTTRDEEDRMHRLVLCVSLAMLTSSAFAFDNGQYDHVPPDIRAWFKSVIAPNGVPCCDVSDGHHTDYDVRSGAYWVPIEGEWMEVPERAIIRDRGNPVGQAVVWYVRHRGAIIISCFVPADAV